MLNKASYSTHSYPYGHLEIIDKMININILEWPVKVCFKINHINRAHNRITSGIDLDNNNKTRDDCTSIIHWLSMNTKKILDSFMTSRSATSEADKSYILELDIPESDWTLNFYLPLPTRGVPTSRTESDYPNMVIMAFLLLCL